jgi:hypothetical protein
MEMKSFSSWPLGGESEPSTVNELNRRPNHPDLHTIDIQGRGKSSSLPQNFSWHEEAIRKDVWGIF